MNWFRLYKEIIDDPKIGELKDSEFRLYIEILCVACEANSNGNTLLSEEKLKWRVRKRVSRAIKTLTKAGLIYIDDEEKNIVVPSWDKRQFSSDSSKNRTNKYRDKRQENGLARNAKLANSFLYSRDHNTCIYCGSKDNLCIDHILPICLGGTDDNDNLGVSCKACNSGKSGRTPEGAKYTIKNPDAADRYKRYVTVTPSGCNSHCDGIESDTEQNRTDKEKNSVNVRDIELRDSKKDDNEIYIKFCSRKFSSFVPTPQNRIWQIFEKWRNEGVNEQDLENALEHALKTSNGVSTPHYLENIAIQCAKNRKTPGGTSMGFKTKWEKIAEQNEETARRFLESDY